MHRGDIFLNALAPGLADQLEMDHVCAHVDRAVAVVDEFLRVVTVVVSGPGPIDECDGIEIDFDPVSARALAAQLVAAADACGSIKGKPTGPYPKTTPSGRTVNVYQAVPGRTP